MKKLEEFRQKFKELGRLYLEEYKSLDTYREILYNDVIYNYDINQDPTINWYGSDQDFHFSWHTDSYTRFTITNDELSESYTLYTLVDNIEMYSGKVHFDKNEYLCKLIDNKAYTINSKLNEISKLESEYEELKSMLE